MQTGYRYNRDAQAKYLKASVKNSKRDKVLYGAVIKAESVFSSMTPSGIPPAPPAPPSGLPPPAPASAPTAPVPSAPAPSGPPNPFAAVLSQLGSRRGSTVQPLRTTGSAGPSTPQSAPVSTSHTPLISPELIGSIKSNLTPPGTRVIKQLPPKPKTATELFQEELAARAASRLNPVDSRQSNVGVISPSDQVPPLASIAETLKPVKGSPTGSEASTVASTVASTIVPAHPSIAPPAASSPAASSPDEEKMPALISEPLDPRGTVIQAKAIKLINLVNAAKIKAGVSTSKQFAFTPFKFDGTQIDDRITMKPEASNKEKAEAAKKNEKPKLKYRFDLTVGSSRTIMKGNHGIDIDKSLDMAIQAIEQDNRLNVDRKTGERTGAGFGDGELDTERIGSSRVIYKSNKGANGVAKGQIYLMLPQLIKGHIRLYNKSGRPVITRSNVSPSFQRIAKDIVERNTFEADDYSTIDPKESADVNKFIEATKPIQPRNINHLSNADTIWQLKKRYEVLVGELSSGNTGKLVRDEMETILRNLIRLHALNIDKGRQLIRSLREF